METPNQRFTRLAEARVNKILDGYRLLTNLVGSNYKSDQAQRRELLQVLRNGLDELEAVFAGEKMDQAKFKFSSSTTETEDEPVVH